MVDQALIACSLRWEWEWESSISVARVGAGMSGEALIINDKQELAPGRYGASQR